MSWREVWGWERGEKSYFGTGTCDTVGDGAGRRQLSLYANRQYR